MMSAKPALPAPGVAVLAASREPVGVLWPRMTQGELVAALQPLNQTAALTIRWVCWAGLAACCAVPRCFRCPLPTLQCAVVASLQGHAAGAAGGFCLRGAAGGL